LIPETELILCCAHARTDPVVARRITTLAEGPLDWELLVRAAAPQGVTALLYAALRTVCPDAVPGSILRALDERYQANVRRNLLIVRELSRLLGLMDARGIRVIPFKGPLLAAMAYGNLALRHSYDLDLLVHPREFSEAKDVLLSEGYHLEYEAEWECHLLAESRQWLVDLHQRIVPRYFPVVAGFAELWGNMQPVLLAGRPVRTLAPEDLLLVLSVQLAKDCREWKQRLVQICDTSELVRGHPDMDWDLVLRRAGRIGALRILLLDLELACRLLGAPLPEPIRRALRAEPAVNVLAGEVCARLFPETEGPAEAIRYRNGGTLREDSWFHLRLRERPRDRVRYLYQLARTRFLLLVTPTDRDRELLRLPGPLGFLSYLVRPARVLSHWARTGSPWSPAKPKRREEPVGRL
jgi:hypothetical protein